MVIDSDPWSTVALLLLLIVIVVSFIGSVWRWIDGGSPGAFTTGWVDYLAAFGGLYIALVMRDREARAFRFAFLLWGTTHTAKLLLYWTGASDDVTATFMPGFVLLSIVMRLFCLVFLLQMLRDSVSFEPQRTTQSDGKTG